MSEARKTKETGQRWFDRSPLGRILPFRTTVSKSARDADAEHWRVGINAHIYENNPGVPIPQEIQDALNAEISERTDNPLIKEADSKDGLKKLGGRIRSAFEGVTSRSPALQEASRILDKIKDNVQLSPGQKRNLARLLAGGLGVGIGVIAQEINQHLGANIPIQFFASLLPMAGTLSHQIDLKLEEKGYDTGRLGHWTDPLSERLDANKDLFAYFMTGLSLGMVGSMIHDMQQPSPNIESSSPPVDLNPHDAPHYHVDDILAEPRGIDSQAEINIAQPAIETVDNVLTADSTYVEPDREFLSKEPAFAVEPITAAESTDAQPQPDHSNAGVDAAETPSRDVSSSESSDNTQTTADDTLGHDGLRESRIYEANGAANITESTDIVYVTKGDTVASIAHRMPGDFGTNVLKILELNTDHFLGPDMEVRLGDPMFDVLDNIHTMVGESTYGYNTPDLADRIISTTEGDFTIREAIGDLKLMDVILDGQALAVSEEGALQLQQH